MECILDFVHVVLSSNKLEGMAVTKLSSLLMLGAFVPYFVPAPLDLCASFLPPFWTRKAIAEKRPVFMLQSGLVSVVCIYGGSCL